MMNAKSKMMIKFDEQVIEVNTTFAKMMRNPMSDEYALLQKAKMENPGYAVRQRKIKTNPKKDSYRGLTYARMEELICTYYANDKCEERVAELKKLIDISRCHSQCKRYPTIKKWFLQKYSEVAKFGQFFEEENKEVVEAEIIELKNAG